MISSNFYDVALTAINTCVWKGSEVEKVTRALLELERLHDEALREEARPLTGEKDIKPITVGSDPLETE